jgi:hypothetical protein
MMHRYIVSALIASAKGFTSLWLVAVPFVVTAALSTAPSPQATTPAPSPELDPSEVVRIQVEALRNNSVFNEGIELTYRFASPGNKRITGPLARFIEMVRSTPYDRLLNHLSARYGPMAISGNEARQIVIITDMEGEEIAYYWGLSRQSEGEFKDCWMTNAVIPAERPTQREFVQVLIPHQRVLASPQWLGIGRDARQDRLTVLQTKLFRRTRVK